MLKSIIFFVRKKISKIDDKSIFILFSRILQYLVAMKVDIEVFDHNVKIFFHFFLEFIPKGQCPCLWPLSHGKNLPPH